MKNIGLYADKHTEHATLEFYKTLEQLDFPEGLGLAINNLPDAESGILLEDGEVIEVSLAHCFTLEDVIRELANLIKNPRYDDASQIEKY